MKIYTLFYKNTKLYNKSIFVMPNDETAKEAMKLNLMEKNAERFRNQVNEGNVILKSLGSFFEEDGLTKAEEIDICNLKDLLNDNNGDMESVKSDNT